MKPPRPAIVSPLSNTMADITQNDIDELLAMNDTLFDECFYELMCEKEELEGWLASPPENASPEQIAENEEDLNDVYEWEILYNDIYEKRNAIETPPLKGCAGCTDNELNQQGHYGGCLPDPLEF